MRGNPGCSRAQPSARKKLSCDVHGELQAKRTLSAATNLRSHTPFQTRAASWQGRLTSSRPPAARHRRSRPPCWYSRPWLPRSRTTVRQRRHTLPVRHATLAWRRSMRRAPCDIAHSGGCLAFRHDSPPAGHAAPASSVGIPHGSDGASGAGKRSA